MPEIEAMKQDAAELEKDWRYYKGTIKITDLMIGDYVLYNGEIDRVSTIDLQESIGYKRVWLDNEKVFVDVDDIEPIPLTAEILEKNGFRRDSMYLYLEVGDDKLLEYYLHEHRLRLWWDGIDEWVKAQVKDLLFQCECRTVHEFQHALRLCGIEREIEL